MKISRVSALLFVITLLLAGCGPEEPAVTAVPTRTPRPTFTPTPVLSASQPVAVADTATPVADAPTSTPAPDTPTPVPDQPATDTPTPAPQAAKAVITNAQANVRTGPDTSYALAGTLDRGAEFEIVGKNPAGNWFQLCCLNGQKVWIANFLVDTSGPVDGVPVAADIAAPPPVAPAPPAAPTATPAPAQPTPVPAPVFALAKGDAIAPQENTNPYVTFYGWICRKQCPSEAVGGYKLVVEGPLGRGEAIFDSVTLIGPNDAFWYNAKVEFAGTSTGDYRAWVTDMSGNQVAEAWTLTVSGTMRTLLPRWVAP
ncbi:MAG: hypothetical protein DWI57_07000 [Chloroflexi bacterium]|nr:MAG: hypothetical protein DWI57_07000 [Chloroflexota bacterium]